MATQSFLRRGAFAATALLIAATGSNSSAAQPVDAQPAASSPAPSPAATGLRLIGKSRTSYFCSTLAHYVAPTVAALQKNDDVVAASRRAFSKASDDYIKSRDHISPDPMAVDRIYFDQLDSSLVHNLALVDKLLEDPKRFPKDPKTDDEYAAAILKQELEAVEQHQKDVLNMISGMVETERMGQMMTDLPGGLASIGNPPNVTPSAYPDDAYAAAGLQKTPSDLRVEPRDVIEGIAGLNIYGRAGAVVQIQQTRTARDEALLTDSILRVVPDCR